MRGGFLERREPEDPRSCLTSLGTFVTMGYHINNGEAMERRNPAIDEIEDAINLVCSRKVNDWEDLAYRMRQASQHYLEHEFGVKFRDSLFDASPGNRAAEPQGLFELHLEAVRKLSEIAASAPFALEHAVDFVEALASYLPAVAASAKAASDYRQMQGELEQALGAARDRRTMEPRQRNLFDTAIEILKTAQDNNPEKKRAMELGVALEESNRQHACYSAQEFQEFSAELYTRFKVYLNRARR